MRHSVTLLLAAAAPLFVSVAAHAATMDTFTVTPVGGGTAITFQLASTPTGIILDGVDFQIDGVMTSAGLENILFFSSSDHGGLGTETPQNVSLINTYGPQLFSGTSSAPTFLVGTFTLTNPSTGFAADSLSVAQLASTVTPEPSSLILLGTGALGLFDAARRRFQA